MDDHINQSLYADSIKEATKVEFLASSEELFYMLFPCIIR